MESNININQNNTQNNPSDNLQNLDKIKFNCHFTKYNKFVKLEADRETSLKNLKQMIIESQNLEQSIKIYHNDKDITQCLKIKLCDLFENNSENKNTEINLKINLLKKRPKKTSEKRLKYMLECPIHPNENAHFYCFTCQLSFCTLCIEDHHKDEFIDKYQYSKSNEEIVNGIMEDFINSVKKSDEQNKNFIFSQIVNQINKEDSNKNLNQNFNSTNDNLILDFDKKLREVKTTYEELCNNQQILVRDKSQHKIEDLKHNLLKFKMICHNSLNYPQNKKIADIIVLEEEYFLEIHKTLRDLKMGKNALLNYMNTLNKEFEEDKINFENFEYEIKNDLDKIIEKIRNKLKREDVSNISKCDEDIEFFENKENKEIKENKTSDKSIITSNKYESSEYLKVPLGYAMSNYESNLNLNNDTESKDSFLSNQIDSSICVSERNSQMLQMMKKNRSHFQSEISTSPSEILSKKYIMKRRLGMDKKPPDVILYNFHKKTFEVKKIISKPEIKFKRFFQFSVFINVDNILYISGGKRKNGKCVSDFYQYNPENCVLEKLPDMINERCSHSMIFINNSQIGLENQIFIVGGYSNNYCEKYSINDNKWERLPDLNYKERQVPTLFIYNQTFLICVFGYINKDSENEDFLERLDLNNLSNLNNFNNLSNLANKNTWEKIKINHKLENKFGLKIFNVGIIPINQNQFLICGGEHYQGEETDNVYILDMKNNSVNQFENLKLPIKSSFIDKNFVRCTPVKFAQYEMKKNNLLIFDCVKCKFKLKPF